MRSRDKIKVLVVTDNALIDKKTITEAKLLSEANMEVLILGFFRVTEGLLKQINGCHIKPIKAPGIRFIRHIIGHIKLFKAMLVENADYIHVHSSALLMLSAFWAAKLKGCRFVADYNNILVLEQFSGTDTYYEQEGLWGSEISEVEKDRIHIIHRLIPEDVNSILDAGCGDGRVANSLQNRFKVTGFDRSAAAIRHVKTEKFFANIEKIPLNNSSFDLTICSEVIEHLREPIFSNTLRELARVSSKYIILGVPYNEQLSFSMCYCPLCKVKFHVNHHHHRFNYDKLSELFSDDFALIKYNYSGTNRICYHPVLLFIKRHFGRIWAKTGNTVCPVCHQKMNPFGFAEHNSISYLCDFINNELNKRRSTGQRHVIALYKKIAK